MSYRVVIAAPRTDLAADLAEAVTAAGAQTVATMTSELQLREELSTHDADVVLVREDITASGVWPLVRELVVRHPYLAIVVASQSGSAETLVLAMDSGARAVVELPLQVEDVATKIMSAGGWAQTMRRVIGGEREAAVGTGGRLVVLAGAKGGVGTTTLSTHLALASAQNDPARRVCLVDLDLTKGDVPLYLDAQHRRTVLDLAPLAHDLGPRALADALYQHPSGLSVLLAPAEGEYAERLGAEQVSLILTALRQRYDVVVVDAGAVLTEASATAVELADEVFVVTMPDVPALRGARRAVESWDRLGLRKEEAVRCILNRCDRRTDIQPDTAARITGLSVAATRMPAAFRALEAASNQRDPDLASTAWQQRVGELATEIGISRPLPLSGRSGQRAARSRGTQPGRRRGATRHGELRELSALPAGSDAGQASLELVGLFPILLLVVLFAWQAVLIGVGAHYASNSAAEGARAAAVGHSARDVADAARAAVPDSFRHDLRVQVDGTQVRVSLRPPLFLPGARPLDFPVHATSRGVSEQ